ncbi:MAG: hypothetical protein CMK59_10075 [Proteobacteria bacterium]|nr:hypothetical protein [Pseudomonadota bacterium]
MRLLFIFAKKISKKAITRIMDKVGGRLVSTMADTSSDAPNAFHKPKRDLYSTMHKNEHTQDNKSEEKNGEL